MVRRNSVSRIRLTNLIRGKAGKLAKRRWASSLTNLIRGKADKLVKNRWAILRRSPNWAYFCYQWPEKFHRSRSIGESKFDAKRCVPCGEVVDPVILRNRGARQGPMTGRSRNFSNNSVESLSVNR